MPVASHSRIDNNQVYRSFGEKAISGMQNKCSLGNVLRFYRMANIHKMDVRINTQNYAFHFSNVGIR